MCRLPANWNFRCVRFPVDIKIAMLFMGRDTHLLAGHDNELRPYIANGIVFARRIKALAF